MKKILLQAIKLGKTVLLISAGPVGIIAFALNETEKHLSKKKRKAKKN